MSNMVQGNITNQGCSQPFSLFTPILGMGSEGSGGMLSLKIFESSIAEMAFPSFHTSFKQNICFIDFREKWQLDSLKSSGVGKCKSEMYIGS